MPPWVWEQPWPFEQPPLALPLALGSQSCAANKMLLFVDQKTDWHTIWMVLKWMVCKQWFAYFQFVSLATPKFDIVFSQKHLAALSQNVLALCSRWNAASSLGNIQNLLWVATCSARHQGPDALRAFSINSFSSASFLHGREETRDSICHICNMGRCEQRLKVSISVPLFIGPMNHWRKGARVLIAVP